MKIGFPPIWTECMKLAEVEDFENINAKLVYNQLHRSVDL